MPLDELVALDYPEIDLTNADATCGFIREVQPIVIVNAAAYTDVDKAETEPEAAFAVNDTATGVLTEKAKKLGMVLIHYSTDYVFDGQKEAPYTEIDPPSPINVYGKSKLAGERAIQYVDGTYLMIRTSWVYSTW